MNIQVVVSLTGVVKNGRDTREMHPQSEIDLFWPAATVWRPQKGREKEGIGFDLDFWSFVECASPHAGDGSEKYPTSMAASKKEICIVGRPGKRTQRATGVCEFSFST